jgi:hypothetical protein
LARRGLQALGGHPGRPFVVVVEEFVEVAVEAGNADDRVIDEQEQLANQGLNNSRRRGTAASMAARNHERGLVE